MNWSGIFVVIFGIMNLTSRSHAMPDEKSPIPEKRRIRLGETSRLELQGASRVRLSREGVVFLRHGKGEEWLLTGISKGIVLLHVEAQTPRDLVVEVYAPPQRPHTPVPLRTTNSTEREGCSGHLAHFPSFEFPVSMISRRESHEAGLPVFFDLGGRWLAGSTAKPAGVAEFSARMASADTSGTMAAKVVARPQLALFPGHEAIARSGGEFRIEAPVLHSPGTGGNPNGIFPGRIDVWKEYGLAIRAKWDGCLGDAAIVDYEVSVTQRISGSEQHLLAGRVSGKRAVEPGESVFGGAVNFMTGANAASGSSLLEGIPVIGPLFSRNDREAGDAILSVGIRAVSELEGNAEGGVSPGEPVK